MSIIFFNLFKDGRFKFYLYQGLDAFLMEKDPFICAISSLVDMFIFYKQL